MNIATVVTGVVWAMLIALALGALVAQINNPPGHAPHYSGDASIRHKHGVNR